MTKSADIARLALNCLQDTRAHYAALRVSHARLLEACKAIAPYCCYLDTLVAGRAEGARAAWNKVLLAIDKAEKGG